MSENRWHESWKSGKIGFHQTRFNTRLEKYWPALGLEAGAPVLVPLCGKSLDMLLLHQLGHPVVGVELSEIAVEAFFVENDLSFEHKKTGNLHEFTGTGKALGIRLLAGDLFELETAQTGPLKGFYDRASLIALPPETRQQYVDKMASLLPSGAVGLLIGLSYDPSKMSGPPFSVPDTEVRTLFAQDFQVTELSHSSGPDRLGNLADRGLDTMDEHVYQLLRT